MLYSPFDCRAPILTCRSGETGRRAGLKIPWGSPPVWVRFPPPAPAFAPLRLATLLGELRLGKPVHTRRLSRRSCGRRAAIRTTAKADRSRSPPACHSPRGATAGQASPHAKAVPPKLWEESRHPDHSEGGPLSLPSGLPLSSGSYGWASQSTREGCPAEAVGGQPSFRTTAKADRSRSPPACHSPRGATAGQASPHAKAVSPKLWEESRHPDHSEGGPLSLPSSLPLSSGS